MWHTHTMYSEWNGIFCSSSRKETLVPATTRCPREHRAERVSQAPRQTLHASPKWSESQGRQQDAPGEGGWKLVLNQDRAAVWEVERGLETEGGDGNVSNATELCNG